MDIGDCNSEFLMSLSEDNPCRLTHFPLILHQTAIRRYFVQLKQYRQWRDWMRKNQEQPQITPVWVTSTTILLPRRKKHGVIRKNSASSTERTTKLSQLILYFIQLCQHKIYFTHTHYWLPEHKSDENAHYSLEDSATELFLPHWRSDKSKQSNAQ